LKKIDETLGFAATKIAKDIDANSLITIEKLPKEEDHTGSDEMGVKVSIFKQLSTGMFKKIEYKTKTKKLEFGSIVPIKTVLIEAINKRYIEKGEKVVCVQDPNLGSGYQGLLFIFDVDEIFFKIGQQKLSEYISSEIVEATINLAKEIGEEGREGRKIGTAFIIGDPQELNKHLKQMIINPFYNITDKPKITDPDLKETIKNFAQLDGAFVINQEGEILSAGTYIDINTAELDFPDGFGTKHRACAALTKETNAIAVVVSESGGKVRVLKQGRISIKV
jgi:DNA integrity scanning protein DisA with diadenylate cyclase activity